jgi:N utilization substance protein B
MLSRRHLRIKVFQAVYAYHHDENPNLMKAEKQLRQSINEIYRLYLHELRSLQLVHQFAKEQVEQRRNKKLPTQADLNPNLRFVENSFLSWLDDNEPFAKAREEFRISFGDDREILRNVFKRFSEDERYQAYMENDTVNLGGDKKIVKILYGDFITVNESLQQIYEDRNMHWADDLDAAQAMVAKTITSFNRDSNSQSPLPQLIKDQEDLDFAIRLFRNSIAKDDHFQKLITEKAKHWESDRLAQVDNLLMKIALAEFVSFDQIPLKVSLNEYIEIAKQYSTPRSGQFINGILDKLKEELQESGEIRKIGRGLL